MANAAPDPNAIPNPQPQPTQPPPVVQPPQSPKKLMLVTDVVVATKEVIAQMGANVATADEAREIVFRPFRDAGLIP